MSITAGAPTVPIGHHPRPGRLVYHQGEVLSREAATLPLTTQALHYGTGVFEGIRGYRAPDTPVLHLFRAADHFARFLRSARLLRIDVPATVDELVGIAARLVAGNGDLADVYLRPLAYKLGLLPGTPPGVGLRGISSAVSIVTHVLGPYHPSTGIRCLVSTWRRPSAAAVPVQAKLTGGYVNCALAVDEARAAGYDDAILLDERGQVAEASTANVFAVVRGRLVTPPPAGILPGITRDTALVLASELGVDRAEQPLEVADLLLADEVFLTGTGIGIAPVVEISGRCIGIGRPGPISTAIAHRYESAVRGHLPDHHDWLTRVEIG